MNEPEKARDVAGGRGKETGTTRRVSSEQLLAGRRELLIEHGGEEYRLLLTRNGKLILTK